MVLLETSAATMDKLDSIMKEILTFRDERDWKQFHTPRNLTAALAIEAAELQELLLWKSDQEVDAYLDDLSNRKRVSNEIADVLSFALLLCHATGIHPVVAIHDKIKLNAKKYPVQLSKGKATKYTELKQRRRIPKSERRR
jgi:NTP pyrophosphatase (non-canonical NTP hydrolase)